MADSMRIRPPDPSDRVDGLASSIIHAYHGEHDADAALALLADPFSWIGADEGDGGIGVESFLSAWREKAEPSTRYDIVDERYDAIELAPGTYLVTGSYGLRIASAANATVCTDRRVSMVFQRAGESFRCHQIHLSGPSTQALTNAGNPEPGPNIAALDMPTEGCRELQGQAQLLRSIYKARARHHRACGDRARTRQDQLRGRPHAPFQPLPIPQGPRERALRRRAAPGYRLF